MASMQTSRADSNSNSNSTSSSSIKIPERPPVLKRSKTITDDAATAHFPGPLFPAVRRVATSPSQFDRGAESSTSSSSATSGGSSFSDHAFNLADRDYVYPSFLGPYATRSRATVKSPSRSPVTEPTLSRNASLPSNLTVDVSRPKLESVRKIGAAIPPRPGKLKQDARPKMAKLKGEMELNSLSLQVQTNSSSSGASNSSSNSYSARKSQGFGSSWTVNLLTFICTLSTCCAIYLQHKVGKLQEDNGELRRICIPYSGNSFDLLDLGNGISYSFFSSTDSRKIALYTVICTLVTPFAIYRCLDYAPQIRKISSRTKDNKEGVPLKKRIAYTVDVCFSVYPYAKLLALLFATLFLIGFGGLALYAVSDGSFSEALWLSWSFVADSGNHAETVGTGPRIVSVSISSGGMLIFAMMLGLVSDAISEKVDSLRKGKSEVIENNHILILGWSDKLGSLLKQLAIANKSIGGGGVVVLAERDKEEMEMDIAKLEFDFMGTSVICRSGSPLILADLKKVSVSKARAIIVLASDENADQSDARALRVVLSLAGVREGLKGHVVVEMSDLDNEPLVKLVGGELIETVVAHDVIGRLMIQCALQPGLAQIWEDILGFENAEFYIKRWPQLDGLQFHDVLISFPDAIPCGVKVAAEGGKIIMNPDNKYLVKEGDEILVIAEDDDTYAPGSLPEKENRI